MQAILWPDLTAHAAAHVSASTQNQALHALLFLYRKVLDVEVGLIDGVVRAKLPERLPIVLTHEEVKQVTAHLDGGVLLVCTLLYGSGMRLLECLHMRVKDLDFQRNQISPTLAALSG